MDKPDAAAFAKAATAQLFAHADAAQGAKMDAYIKCDARGDNVRCLGVSGAARKAVLRALKKTHAPASAGDRLAQAHALWAVAHREARLLAIDWAMAKKAHITEAGLGTYEAWIRESRWWDMVDPIAIHLVGRLFLTARDALRPRLAAWLDDDDLWMRRTAVLASKTHKTDTDAAFLFAACAARAHETDFFMRKAIGWALREYSRTAPDDVRAFVAAHRAALSPLSAREALRLVT